MDISEVVKKINIEEDRRELIKNIAKRKFIKEFYPNTKNFDVDINKKDINPIFYHILKSDARVIINYGGRDSGKSFFTGGQYIPLALETEDYFRGVAIRKTNTSNKDSTYQEILDGVNLYKMNHNIRDLKAPLEFRHKNNNKIIFRGMDDLVNLKSLKGINFWWFEEAEDLTERQYHDLLILLRGSGYQRAILTFNPMDQEHFTNNKFVTAKKDRIIETFPDGDPKVWEIDVEEDIDRESIIYTALVVCSTYDDNKFISPIRKLVIEQLKESDPYLYEVYRKGKYATKGGRILSNWEEVDFGKKGYNFLNYDNKGYAQDFGFNHANCVLSTAEKDECLYIFDEIYVREMDTGEIIQVADKKGLDKTLRMVCDSAEPDRIKMWKDKGYKAFGVKKFQGSVNAQIDRLKQYKKIYINSKCKNTLKEVKSWMWKMDKNGNYTDDPVTTFDDAMAALRYCTDLYSTPQRRSFGVFLD